jgi:hypothetical protein
MRRLEVWRHFLELGSLTFVVLAVSVACTGMAGDYAAEGENVRATAFYALAGLIGLGAVVLARAFVRQLLDYRRAVSEEDDTERQVSDWLDSRRRPVPWGRREPE